jgi:hypothetical protein
VAPKPGTNSFSTQKNSTNLLLMKFQFGAEKLIDDKISSTVKTQTKLQIQKNEETFQKNYENSFKMAESFNLVERMQSRESMRSRTCYSVSEVVKKHRKCHCHKPFVATPSAQEVRAKLIKERNLMW